MNLWGTFQVLRMFAREVGHLPAGHLWYLLRRMRNEKPHRFGRQIRINTFFPPWPSSAFERFLANVRARRRVPYSCYLAVTGDCPYRCAHCSYGGRPSGNLPTAALLDLLAQVRSLGTCTMGFTGGEPLLREDLEDLVAQASRLEMATIVFTTGHGLTPPRAARLASSGLTCLTVGIESAGAAEHDRVRGQAGSFEQAKAAARIAREAGLYLALSTVGTSERIASGELERMYGLAAQWGAAEFRLLAPVATGAAATCGTFMLTPDRKRALYDFHVVHNRSRGGPAVASFAYLESPEMFGCGAGYHHLFLDATGEVCPCDLTPLSFGNATREPLAEIWNRMAKYFPLPRCACMMRELSAAIGADQSLPLPRSTSESICPPRPADAPLPGCYKRLTR